MCKKKDCVIKFRVTAEQKEELKARALELGYDTVSSFFIDSALRNCTGSASSRLKLLNEWYDTYHKTNLELSRIGTNLNQLAKYENILSFNAIRKYELLDENLRIKKECMSLLDKMKSFNEFIFKELKRIK